MEFHRLERSQVTTAALTIQEDIILNNNFIQSDPPHIDISLPYHTNNYTPKMQKDFVLSIFYYLTWGLRFV